MNLIDGMIEELKHEAASTHRLLERLPDDKLGFKPHEKSFSLGELSSHVTSLIGWTGAICQMEYFVFKKDEWPTWIGKRASEICERFDSQVAQAIETMKPLTNEDLQKVWTMADDQGNVFMSAPRVQILRGMILNHLIHHRGQLTVYLRMCDVPLPAIYGPSADEAR